jgi:hypothetical protein
MKIGCKGCDKTLDSTKAVLSGTPQEQFAEVIQHNRDIPGYKDFFAIEFWCGQCWRVKLTLVREHHAVQIAFNFAPEGEADQNV